MTRYEKLKPGMEFLHGYEDVKTVDDAVDLAMDFIECWYCPFNTSCAGVDVCKDNIRAYLEEEIE